MDCFDIMNYEKTNDKKLGYKYTGTKDFVVNKNLPFGVQYIGTRTNFNTTTTCPFK